MSTGSTFLTTLLAAGMRASLKSKKQQLI